MFVKYLNFMFHIVFLLRTLKYSGNKCSRMNLSPSIIVHTYIQFTGMLISAIPFDINYAGINNANCDY